MCGSQLDPISGQKFALVDVDGFLFTHSTGRECGIRKQRVVVDQLPRL